MLQGHDGFVLALELTAHYGVHGGVPVAHLFPLVLGLLLGHLVLDVQLVPDVIEGPHALLAFQQQPVDQVSHLDLQAALELVLDLAEYVLEVFVVTETGDLQPGQVVPLPMLLALHEVQVLLHVEQLALQLLNDVVQHGLAHVAPLLNAQGGLLGAGKASFHSLDAVLVVGVKLLQEFYLLLIVLAKADHFIEENS